MSNTSGNAEDNLDDLSISMVQQNQSAASVATESKRGNRRRDYLEKQNDQSSSWTEDADQKKQIESQQNDRKNQSKTQARAHQPRNIQRKKPSNQEQKQKSSSSGDHWDEVSMKKEKSQKGGRDAQRKSGREKKKINQSNNILDQIESDKKSLDEKKSEKSGSQEKLDLTIVSKEEVEKDKKELDTSWVGQQEETQPNKAQTRGNRKPEPDRQNDNAPVRGNRGNRESSGNDYQRNDGFKKKSQYEDGNRNSNNYHTNYGGFNSYGGRGGRGRDNNNYRQRREFDNNNRDANYRDQGNNYRGGFNNNNNNNNRPDKPYDHVPRNYEKRGNFNRSESDFYQNRDRDRNRDRDYEYNNNKKNYQVENERKAKMLYEAENNQRKQQKVVEPKKQQQPQPTPSAKTVKILPRGQKCWPDLSMYVNQTKLSFSYRQITEHECDILIIPYKDLKLEIYPGNIINKCKADYRKKILQKGNQIEEAGYIYAQKCIGIPNFKAFGFLKMGKTATELRACIAGILPKLKQLKMPVFSILIPYSKDMGPAKEFMQIIIEGLGKQLGFTEVNISTNNATDFKAGLNAFSEQIEGFMDENKICIEY